MAHKKVVILMKFIKQNESFCEYSIKLDFGTQINRTDC